MWNNLRCVVIFFRDALVTYYRRSTISRGTLILQLHHFKLRDGELLRGQYLQAALYAASRRASVFIPSVWRTDWSIADNGRFASIRIKWISTQHRLRCGFDTDARAADFEPVIYLVACWICAHQFDARHVCAAWFCYEFGRFMCILPTKLFLTIRNYSSQSTSATSQTTSDGSISEIRISIRYGRIIQMMRQRRSDTEQIIIAISISFVSCFNAMLYDFIRMALPVFGRPY